MKSDMKAIADEIQGKLLDMGFTVHRLDASTTNSVYLKVDCGVCHSIRVSDHRGKEHLKFRYNIGTFVKKFRSVNDMYRRYYFTVDEVDRLVKFVKYDRVRAIDVLGGRRAARCQLAGRRSCGLACGSRFRAGASASCSRGLASARRASRCVTPWAWWILGIAERSWPRCGTPLTSSSGSRRATESARWW